MMRALVVAGALALALMVVPTAASAQCPDSDGDGVCDSVDLCPDTSIPEAVPSEWLNPNHFALTDGDLTFDTVCGGWGKSDDEKGGKGKAKKDDENECDGDEHDDEGHGGKGKGHDGGYGKAKCDDDDDGDGGGGSHGKKSEGKDDDDHGDGGACGDKNEEEHGGGCGGGWTYTTTDTGGCSCEQIVAARGLGKGHLKHGCSKGVMTDWIAQVPVCVPACDGALCGPDGCGGVCGECGADETCSAGACVPVDPCAAIPDASCDDGNPCTWDACNPDLGGCESIPDPALCVTPEPCCAEHPEPGCAEPDTVLCVCGALPECCGAAWLPECADMAELCGAQDCCQPLTCAEALAECGPLDDGCGGTLDCGACGGDQACVSGQCQSVGCPTDQVIVALPDGGGNAVDLLLVLDTSASMAEEVYSLANNVYALWADLLSRGVDFHIGVVTVDMEDPTQSGRLQGGVLTSPSSPNQLVNILMQGSNGASVEQGLLAATTALTLPENDGFRRPGVPLHILWLSDEDDQSPGAPDEYLMELLMLTEGQVTGHAIVGTDPLDYCASVGQRYIDVASMTGGVVGSICQQDFGPVLGEIGSGMGGSDTIVALPQQPEAGTIVLQVDGTPCQSSDFWYDAGTNSVTLSASASCRGAGAILTVDYTVSCGTCTPTGCPGDLECGAFPDGCGGLVSCGFCPPDAVCVGGFCEPTVCFPMPEVCDGIDNDCDGVVDNGACGGCVPMPEVCDGIDNDCDGVVDNGACQECFPGEIFDIPCGLCGVQTVVCGPSGVWELLGLCEEPPSCGGDPGGGICDPASTGCVDDTTIGTCNADGTAWDMVEPCAPGEWCTGGQCLAGCEAVAQSGRLDIGCEYWSVDLDQYADPFGDPINAPYGIVVSNPGNATATLTFDTVAPGYTFDIPDPTVPAGTSRMFVLPSMNVDGTGVSGKSARIVSDQPVLARQLNPLDGAAVGSSDASHLLPASAAGTEYLVLTWPSTPTFSTFEGQRGYFTVVAVRPGETLVTVMVTDQTLAGPNIPAMQAGDQVEVTLSQGEVLNVEADAGTFVIGGALPTPGDLTGSWVSATQDVVVFGGHEQASVDDGMGGDSCCADHLEEQMFPVAAWRDSVLAVKTRPRGGPEPDCWRVMAGAAGVNVTTIPPIAGLDGVTLGKGEWVQVFTSQSFEIHATGPILAGQYTVGGVQTADLIGDPSLILAVPTVQFLDAYTIVAPAAYQESYVTLVRPAGAEIIADGAPVSASEFAQFGSGAFERAYLAVEPGQHTFESSHEFGLTSYGWSPAASYGLPGGLDPAL